MASGGRDRSQVGGVCDNSIRKQNEKGRGGRKHDRYFQKRNRMAFPSSSHRGKLDHASRANLNLQDALAICCRPQEVKKTLRGAAERLMP